MKKETKTSKAESKRRLLLKKKLEKESALVAEESMAVLKEFEQLEQPEIK